MKRNTSFLKGFGSETMNKWISNGDKTNKPSTQLFSSKSFVVIFIRQNLFVC
jgi:hypothetical protein